MQEDLFSYSAPNDSLFIRQSVSVHENQNRYENHQHYEILILLSENAEFQVEATVYRMKKGDVILLNRNEMHKISYDQSKPYERIVIDFEKKCVLPYFSETCNLLNAFEGRTIGTNNIIVADVAKKYEIFELYSSIKKCAAENGFGCNVAVKCCFIRMLVEINRAFAEMVKTYNLFETNGKIPQILNYINLNLSSDLTLESLSERFYLSKYYLAHIFKNATGFSVSHYITYKRVALAQKLLTDGHSATEACSLSGFNDYSNFYKSFIKIVGHPPKLFKDK